MGEASGLQFGEPGLSEGTETGVGSKLEETQKREEVMGWLPKSRGRRGGYPGNGSVLEFPVVSHGHGEKIPV